MRHTSGTAHRSELAFDAARAFEPLPEDLTHCATVDPHDKTLETEITDEMISEAISAMDEDSAYPYRGVAGGAMARPFRTADIIPFPRRLR